MSPTTDLSEDWGYSRRPAPRPNFVVTERQAREAAAPNPIGFYSGVSLLGNHLPPFPADTTKSAAVLTWTGFERQQGSSSVYFQLSAAIDHQMTTEGPAVIKIRMRNTKPNVRNNMRRLDLRFFETPVREVVLRRKGKDTVATIILKHEASAQVDIRQGQGGYKLLVVTFTETRARQPAAAQ